MNKIIGHLKTINKHKVEVTKLLFKCGLYEQAIKHDLSKYSLVELKTGFKYFTGTRSPIEKERNVLGYSQSWLHHKGRNKHHWEYWIDKENDPVLMVQEMPNVYIVEMFCDRVAAAKVYQKEKYTNSSAYDYFMSGTDKDTMGESNSRRLKMLLKQLASIKNKEEEKIFFDYIKNNCRCLDFFKHD